MLAKINAINEYFINHLFLIIDKTSSRLVIDMIYVTSAGRIHASHVCLIDLTVEMVKREVKMKFNINNTNRVAVIDKDMFYIFRRSFSIKTESADVVDTQLHSLHKSVDRYF